jgi:hypothetical protein
MFDSTKQSLRELLQALKKGQIQLPEFQRGWVWKNDQIKELIASVIRQYPIGAVMLLEAGGEVRFQTRPVEGMQFASAPPPPELLILDGQQRLTSMFQATLMGHAAQTENERKQKVQRWYYLDIGRLLEEPDALEEADIIEWQHIGSHQIEDEEHLCRPTADAANGNKLFDDGLVVHVGPLGLMHGAVLKMPRQIAEVFDLARRQADTAQNSGVEREQVPRLNLRATTRNDTEQSIPYRLRSLDRDLLPDDRSRQRGEGIAAAVQASGSATRDELAHDPVALGEVLAGILPKKWRLHAAAHALTQVTP